MATSDGFIEYHTTASILDAVAQVVADKIKPIEAELKFLRSALKYKANWPKPGELWVAPSYPNDVMEIKSISFRNDGSFHIWEIYYGKPDSTHSFRKYISWFVDHYQRVDNE